MTSFNKTFFAPQLYIKSGVASTDFYQKAFGAVELRRWNNDDGSIHVAELSIDGALFHIHEVTSNPELFSPEKYEGTTVLIGLFVNDVDKYMSDAISAGATEISPPKDYDYDYRQGIVRDPFGHHWMIEMKL